MRMSLSVSLSLSPLILSYSEIPFSTNHELILSVWLKS